MLRKNFHVLLLLFQQEILLAQMPLPWYNRSLGNQFLHPPVPAIWLWALIKVSISVSGKRSRNDLVVSRSCGSIAWRLKWCNPFIFRDDISLCSQIFMPLFPEYWNYRLELRCLEGVSSQRAPPWACFPALCPGTVIPITICSYPKSYQQASPGCRKIRLAGL